MKKILLTIILFLICIVNVSALSEKFESGDWIQNIYIDKVKDGVIHYKQARFIKTSGSNTIAYCIEPFETLKHDSNYTGYDKDYSKVLGISDDVWKRISQIAYYGYGYGAHTSDKWYAITQVMIWREVDKKASFYFTDSLNGNKISSYDDEISEINELIKEHNKLPSFANKTYDFSINSTNELKDSNEILSKYIIKSQSDNISINKQNNILSISTTEGSSEITFERTFTNYKKNAIVFVDNNYQNVMTPGNVESKSFKLNINTKSGKLKITKIDYDTEKKEPSGEGILVGSIYELYDSNNNLVKSLEIDEQNEAYIDNLPFGNYKLKEVKSMKGYLLDDVEYNININLNNLNIELLLKNKAIKSKVQIYKYFDDKLEKDISFEIYDINKNLVNTITTNEFGKAETELYYGKYTFHQINTTKNYLKVDDFEIIIDENSNNIISLDLKDEKFSIELTIIKQDKNTGKIIKSEAIFKIKNIMNNEYIKVDNSELIKTKNGKIIIEKLYAGDYEIEEYIAPKGYKKLNKKIKITVDDSNKYVDNKYEIEIENEKQPIEVKVPNTSQEYIEKNVYIFDEKKYKY